MTCSFNPIVLYYISPSEVFRRIGVCTVTILKHPNITLHIF